MYSDEFEQIRDFKDPKEGGDFLDNWCRMAMESPNRSKRVSKLSGSTGILFCRLWKTG
jgi:hypothetical protein